MNDEARRRAAQALETARQQLEERPNSVAGLRSAISSLLELGKLDDAYELIERRLASQPGNSTLQKLKRKILDAYLWRMVEEGLADWSGGSPKGSPNPVEITPGPPISDYVIEDRR